MPVTILKQQHFGGVISGECAESGKCASSGRCALSAENAEGMERKEYAASAGIKERATGARREESRENDICDVRTATAGDESTVLFRLRKP